MNNLTTRKIVLGMLMALVLTFSVQGIADALTLTHVSDRVQSNLEDSEFEIKFSVGLKSDTTQIKNDDGKLVNDGGTQRIDSQGYLVTVIDGKDYRNTTITNASSSTDDLVPPTPNTPDPPSNAPSNSVYAGYTVHEKVSSSQYESYSGDIFANSSKAAFSSRGYALYYYTPAFDYDHDDNADTDERTASAKVTSQIKIRDERFATRTAKSNRYHYNDEAIAINVSTVASDGTLAATTDMTVRLKSGSTSYPVNVIAIPTVRPGTPAALSITTASLWEGGGIRSLPSSITLICTSATAAKYRVTITDVSPANDFPSNAPETLELAPLTFTLYVEDDAAPTGSLNFSEATGSLLRLETAKSIEPIHTHFDLTAETLANKSIRYKVTEGSGLLYVGTPTREDITPVSDLTIHKGAAVYLKVNQTDNEVVAAIAGQGLRTHGKTLVFDYTGTDRRTTSTPSTPSTPAPPAPPALTVSTTSISGAPSSAHTLTITTTAPLAQISVNPSTAFRTAGGFASPAIATTTANTYTSTITLPAVADTYTATVNAGTAGRQITITVGAGSGSQTPTVTVGIQPGSGAPGSTATVTVTATDASGNPAAGVVVTLSITSGGGTLVPSTVTTGTTGTATSALTRGSTAGSNYFITASAFGYTFRSGLTSGERVVISGTSSGTSSGGTVGAAAEVDVYDGNNQDGSLNSRLAEPFIVEVVDANDNPVEDARVRFRTTIGSGRFSPRTPRTDEDGFAETTFTPTSTGRIRVVATVTGVDSTAAFIVQGGEPADALEKVSGDNQSGTPGNALANPFVVEVQDEDGEPLTGHSVTFSVTAGGGSLSATSATADEDGRAETTLTLGSERGVNSVRASVAGADPVIFNTSIDAKILVVAANRPVMYWIAGGGLYSLSGAKEAKIAESANGVAVGGGKIYWTSQVNASSGTINSANLDGTGVATVTSIQSVPVGIAVDTAGSKLYWTNARGRIQSASLNGSGIQNVMQNLSAPTDIVVSNGFIYWTEGGNSVRRVNIRGQKIAIDVAVNLGTVGGLAVGGGKVYWTEQTSASAGTVNGANLNGTNFETLATLQAAPMGISVDTAGSKLYWTNARGRVQSANLNGSMIKTVVEGLISPSKLAIGGSNTETEAMTRQPTAKKDNAKYDVNGDGAVDNTDASLVAAAMNTSNTKYDVNGDGTVNFLDLLLVFDNREDAAAAAPTIVGMKLTAIQIDIIQEQIDLLIATNDRSPAALRTLVYMQQLLATARPEKTQLFANYPNPFNPETWIPYELATDTHVTITIYNTQGVVIRTLQFGHQSAGYYTERDRAAYWDGRNALGEQVASGLYFYQLETDEMSSMRKMVILK